MSPTIFKNRSAALRNEGSARCYRQELTAHPRHYYRNDSNKPDRPRHAYRYQLAGHFAHLKLEHNTAIISHNESPQASQFTTELMRSQGRVMRIISEGFQRLSDLELQIWAGSHDPLASLFKAATPNKVDHASNSRKRSDVVPSEVRPFLYSSNVC